MKAFEKARVLDQADLDQHIADALNRMGSSDDAVADDAAHEYAGLMLAQEYWNAYAEFNRDLNTLRTYKRFSVF